MREPKGSNDPEWAALENDCLLYRAVLKPSHIDKQTGTLTKGAFLRRGPKENGTLRDTQGLSVMLAEYCTVDNIRARFDVNGIGELSVGEVRDAAPTDETYLDVIRDKVDHANITGLPEYGEDVFRAENLASELARRCIPIYIKSK